MVDERGARSVESRPDRVDLVCRCNDQHLVRAVPTERGVGGQLASEEVHDHEERVVARGVAVGLVEEPEVVDVDERDGECAFILACLIDRPGDHVDEGAVVQGMGQRIAPRRLDERLGSGE